MSCSGMGLPADVKNSNVPTKQTKKEVMTQTLIKFEKVLSYIPDATVVLAHGGSFGFPYIIDILKKYPNTYTDISLQPSENIKQIIDAVGSDRVLFGTDYPFLNQAFLCFLYCGQQQMKKNEKIFLVITQKKYCIFNYIVKILEEWAGTTSSFTTERN